MHELHTFIKYNGQLYQSTASHFYARTRSFHRPTFIHPGRKRFQYPTFGRVFSLISHASRPGRSCVNFRHATPEQWLWKKKRGRERDYSPSKQKKKRNWLRLSMTKLGFLLGLWISWTLVTILRQCFLSGCQVKIVENLVLHLAQTQKSARICGRNFQANPVDKTFEQSFLK